MALDKLGIRTAIANDFAARFKSDVITELTSQGYSGAELTAVDPYIDALVGIITPASDLALDATEESTETTTNAAVNNAYGAKVEAEQNNKQNKIVRAHEVFNAKSGITFPEPVFSEPKFTEPVDIQDASYSIDEDYPDSYGEIDEAKNWIKVNKAKQHVELVHSSGTSIKIDKEGNVTQEVKGNFKNIIHGDYSLEVKGNEDHIIKKSSYLHVGGEREEVFDKSVTQTIVKDLTQTVTGEVTYKLAKSVTESVGADFTQNRRKQVC